MMNTLRTNEIFRLNGKEKIMTIYKAIRLLLAKLHCMEREVSGRDQECNARKCDECDLNYEQGNMGEQKECLRFVIKNLTEQLVDEKNEIITLLRETNGERFLKAFPKASVVNYPYGDYDYFEVFIDEISFLIKKSWWNATATD